MITIQTASIDEHKLTRSIARQFRIMSRSFRSDEAFSRVPKKPIICFVAASTLDHELRAEYLALVDYGNGEFRWVFPRFIRDIDVPGYEELGIWYDKREDAPFVILS